MSRTVASEIQEMAAKFLGPPPEDVWRLRCPACGASAWRHARNHLYECTACSEWSSVDLEEYDAR